MRKTKTQAQKREERELKQKKEAEERLKQKELRALKFQKERQALPSSKQKLSTASDDEQELDQELVSSSPDEKSDSSYAADKQELSRLPSPTIMDVSKELAVSPPVPPAEEVAAAAAPQVQFEKVAEDPNPQFSFGGSCDEAKTAAIASMQKLSISEAASSRIVYNHSTHCEGLRPVLIRLEKLLPKCTIIPGPLSKGKCHCPEFSLLVQRIKDANTYTLVARNGYTSQDVIISVEDATALNEESLVKFIATAISPKSAQKDEQEISSEICPSAFNREVSRAQQIFWREQHHAKHIQVTQHEQQLKKEQKIEQQCRTLTTKKIDPRQVEAYAERDVDILSGKERGKYSMRR